MTDVPDYIAGARALLAASGCTIDGEPAVVVRVAELNDLLARAHRAEAAARITPDSPRTATALETGQPAEEECCGSEPPADGAWGDCWCTLPSDHDGDCRCEPCTERRGAPGWNTDDTPDASGDAADNPTPHRVCTPCPGCDHTLLPDGTCEWCGPDAVAAPVTADDGLRERVAAAIRAQAETGNVRYEALADAVLAVRDRRMEQLAAGRETWRAKAIEIEAERDQAQADLARWLRHLAKIADRAKADEAKLAQVRRYAQAFGPTGVLEILDREAGR